MPEFNFWFKEFPAITDLFNSETWLWAWLAIIWVIICMRKIFKKAWHPWWGSLIPLYNIYLRFKTSWMSGWRILSFILPPLGIIILFISFFKIPWRFGKHWAFGLWLLITFLNPIFMAILAFDDSKYLKK